MHNMISEQSRFIAHEIRNHISICELYTRIITKNIENCGIENPSITNAINCITKSLKIMNNSLLDLKSLDNFSPEIYDIKTLLQNTIELSRVYICEKDIKINFSCNESAKVLVDENKFLACIVNIIKNAIEAILEKGEINISINIHKATSNPTHHLNESELTNSYSELVTVKISNNGEPIENPQEIFDIGFTTKPTGSGFGLHICANNLKAQNAELKLINSTSEITEFEITLPVYKN